MFVTLGKEVMEMQYEMLRYIIAGGCTTLVNIGIFTVLRYGGGFGLQAANASSIVGAILFAFVINRTFVFRKKGKDSIFREAIQFVGMRAVSMGAELWGMYIFTEKYQMPELFCKLLLQGIIIGMNYGFSKCYIFKKQEE